LQCPEIGQGIDTQIFILSMEEDTALLVLEEAEKLGYSWPEYAWIVLGTQSGSSYPKGVFLVHFFPRISS
jgi:hypothetical protein